MSYLGYELAAELEPRLRLPAGNAPVAVAIRCPAAAIYDHLTREITLVAEHGREDLLDDIEADLHVPPPTPEPGGWIAEFAEDDPAEFLSAVRTAIGHIGRGDIYQANLSRRWAARVPLDIDYGEIYRRLRGANPGPFAGMLALAGLQVLSTSPERLVEARGGWVQTRPIAGTRPRQADDLAAVAALMDSAKERAEHVMLIDLERNDLGRVCCPGTVAVSEYCVVESYAHVHHLVSNVRGRLRPDITPGGIIRAVFPGGTITVGPLKFRCMQLIAEIEGAARCAYTGSMGYLNRDGSLDLNILIRTASVADGILEIRAGAGRSSRIPIRNASSRRPGPRRAACCAACNRLNNTAESARAAGGVLAQIDEHLIDVAPAPALAGLNSSIIGWCVAWKCLVACLPSTGRSSRHVRRTAAPADEPRLSPVFKQSSQPLALGVTCWIEAKCRQVSVIVGISLNGLRRMRLLPPDRRQSTLCRC